MAVSLRYRGQGLPHSYIIAWLANYAANTPGLEWADNATVRLDLDILDIDDYSFYAPVAWLQTK
ncbi:hypothetical protein PN451_10445 [Dolichospermum planctonicum CS-1226]|uniref:Uncharacterized protein n=1 Tax=Dolichospermum planctonicum CS-1226 TaxID=3021751 RepID=A0ABT5AHP0_9CYAN|nr:hypothetical protein [Dolichospermum planctonicum]MDB9536242.1 hypothetical protein [Dolichospermum planctonicum CS-1226]